jgi:archaeal flagellar protein FlaJ
VTAMSIFYKQVTLLVPNLKDKLLQADIPDSPDEFIRKTLVSSFMLSFGVSILFIGGLLKSFGYPFVIALILFPIAFLFLFFYLIKIPDVKIRAKENGINREIVFATRFLIIEIESGVPIYNAFVNVSKVYPVIGTYFGAIIDRVNMGTSMEEAMNEATEVVPSADLRKILWQILNSIKTGADVTNSLGTVLDQIVDDQKIAVEEYGRKLNPLAMFYMLIAVIIPSLGTTMLMIFAGFIGLQLKLPLLLALVGFLGFVQFMFYALIKSSRPAADF